MTHDALVTSLANHLRGPARMVWQDIQLGPSGSVRPDVYTLEKSFVRPHPIAYECKVTASDYLADVTAGKWQTYLKYACGVIFACEEGLLTKDVVPDHCGLMVLKEDRWRTAKRAVLNPVTIPQNALLKLLIDGVQREGPRYRRKAWSESTTRDHLRKKFGEVVAKTIRDRLAVEHEIEDRQRQADRIIKAAQKQAEDIRKEASDALAPLREELCGILGLPITSDKWTLETAVGEVKRALACHPAHAALQRLTQSIQNALQRDGYKDESSTPTERAD